MNKDLNASRDRILASLGAEPLFDLVVVGGGIHGAATANIASRLGFKVALVEMSDFAAATSSRSSKMAHGGLRYLEMFDFQQVFEGIKAREELFAEAPHIVKPEKFLIPIPKGDWFFKLKLKIGLFLYDLLVRDKKHKHRWLPKEELTNTGFNLAREKLEGCFEYTDGLMNDSRLVIEHLLSARANGAKCINYVKVESIKKNDTGNSLHCVDQLSKNSFTLNARLVINCAGPWATALQGKTETSSSLSAKLSRGVHIIFDKKWTGPSLFLPMPGKARYYFVWPHPGGTMIGTTERETTVAEVDPIPTPDELNEVFIRIEKDLPNSGLSRGSAHYCFAGIRTLPLRDSEKNSAQLSRKHIWRLNDGILSLVGGKYTTAVWTAWEGIKEAAKILNHPIPPTVPYNLYQNKIDHNERAILVREFEKVGIKNSHADRIISRYGLQVRHFLDNPAWCEELSPQLLRGELEISLKLEQAVTIEDVLRRRLDLEYRPGNGLEELSFVAEVLNATSTAIEQYRTRIGNIHALLNQ